VLLANLAKRTIEPVGRYFQAYFNRKRHNRTVTEQEAVDKAKNAVDAVEVDSQDDEVETAALLRLDPSSWKVLSFWGARRGKGGGANFRARV